MIRRVEAAGLPVAVQPKYAYRLAQDRNNPNAALGDPAQYTVNKFQLVEVHQITKGDNAVVAVIWVALLTVKEPAALLPNLTAVAPEKLVPVMVTLVPPDVGPVFGLTLVTAGTGT